MIVDQRNTVEPLRQVPKGLLSLIMLLKRTLLQLIFCSVLRVLILIIGATGPG